MIPYRFCAFLLISGSLSLLGCNNNVDMVAQKEYPIIDGHSCDQDESPQAVALILDITSQEFGSELRQRVVLCTGTLIAPDTVLTAAHCLFPEGITNGEITSFTYYVSRAPELSDLYFDSDPTSPLRDLPDDAVAVRTIVRHEDFFEIEEPGLSNAYDIALLFLDTPVTIEPAIVMTPDEAKRLAVGDEVRISGWGKTSNSADRFGRKHCATTTITELGDFEIRLGTDSTSPRKCNGDSGGPTFITIENDGTRKERVIGAASRLYDFSGCTNGSIETLASAWYSWIDEKMTEQCDGDNRVWCDVPGVVPPSFYDESLSESSGCNSSGSTTTSCGLWLAAGAVVTLARRRRRRQELKS